MIYSNSGKRAYGLNTYILDTFEDIEKLNESSLHIGDTAFIIDTSKYYMLNHKFEWKEIYPQGSNNGGAGDLPNNIIYDGGVIVE